LGKIDFLIHQNHHGGSTLVRIPPARTTQTRRCAVLVATLAVTPALPAAPSNAVNKSGYTLTNPTPRELWRGLSADRPDVTESPITVDAGAVQLEMSFFDYAKNGGAESWIAAPFNLKVGLTNDTDIQFVFDTYVHVRDSGETKSGIGDVQIRLKLNLWGNDSGETALAIMPFVKIPTASDDLGNDEFEGGLIIPWGTKLTDTIGLGLMAEVDVVYDDADDDYDLEFVTTAVIGVAVTDAFGVFLEGVGITPTDGDFRALLGFGGTYSLSENVVLDAGVNIGLTGDADDVNVFTGITIRF
jgi:hypothetical protein